jgi:adenylyltransferase/sulfurtransferase
LSVDVTDTSFLFTDTQLLRYSRQIMLPNFDITGQQALCQSKALIVGLGGLGSPVAMYLAAAGVGTLQLVDFDRVELSNLQRQIVHDTDNIGEFKAISAAKKIQALNPDVQCITTCERLDGDALLEAVKHADIVIDGSDNFETRYAINQACYSAGVPLVSGAAIRMEGQVSVFHPGVEDSPCYRCLYDDIESQDLTCSENGVMAPLVGMIGSVQAMEAVKVLAGLGESLIGRLLILDAMNMEWRTLKIRKDPECPVCGGH